MDHSCIVDRGIFPLTVIRMKNNKKAQFEILINQNDQYENIK